MKKKKLKNNGANKKNFKFDIPPELQKKIWGIVFFFLAFLVFLSFYKGAGIGGEAIFSIFYLIIGRAVYALPLLFLIIGFAFFYTQLEKITKQVFLSAGLLLAGFCALLQNSKPSASLGGYLGHINYPFLKIFGFWVTEVFFIILFIVGGLILFSFFKRKEVKQEGNKQEPKPSLIKKIFIPKFEVEDVKQETKLEKELFVVPPAPVAIKSREVMIKLPNDFKYKNPPLELLEEEKGTPVSGDIKENSLIIKKTLENFGIPVEMSEINIGPTVTQYTFKPQEGIKLSKIISLSNDLSLALAVHPIRIEAPIPGKSLVGVEVPNKSRIEVRLRNLISDPQFQNSTSNLNIALGKNVSGELICADLSRMPHLLVAGATGAGKTIFLNSIIFSLIYRNSPQILRFVLIDPKRVEFPIYNELPHIISEVIVDSQKAVRCLRWLIGEMERRFDVLAEKKSRNIFLYNQIAIKEKEELMPYIVVIIDELADLMASKGKDIEGSIVRLAQMARAVGIHLIVATQRPSVEVITGLIKANITSRISFQVASQIDSRTILDMAGAEKLLGRGDMLYLSSELGKPRRIQSSYISEKEIKKVIDWLKENFEKEKFKDNDWLSKEFKTAIEEETEENSMTEGLLLDDDDPLYAEAKKLVIEARKASASLLQRRLRIGYARAARLLDLMEERGLIGPADGAKPRDILIRKAENENDIEAQ